MNNNTCNHKIELLWIQYYHTRQSPKENLANSNSIHLTKLPITYIISPIFLTSFQLEKASHVQQLNMKVRDIWGEQQQDPDRDPDRPAAARDKHSVAAAVCYSPVWSPACVCSVDVEDDRRQGGVALFLRCWRCWEPFPRGPLFWQPLDMLGGLVAASCVPFIVFCQTEVLCWCSCSVGRPSPVGERGAVRLVWLGGVIVGNFIHHTEGCVAGVWPCGGGRSLRSGQVCGGGSGQVRDVVGWGEVGGQVCAICRLLQRESEWVRLS